MSARVACRGDVKHIHQLDGVVYGEPLSRQQINAICIHPASLVFVAEYGEELVGYLLAYTDSCAAEIMRIGVHPAYRRSGHARDMVEQLAATIGEDMSIELKAAGDDIVPWLKACGFSPVEDYSPPVRLYRRGWRFSRAPMLKYRH